MDTANTFAPVTEKSSFAPIWVIDDDVALRMILEDALTDGGYEVITFGNGKTAWQTLSSQTAILPSVILTDIRMPFMDGLTFSEKVASHFPSIPVIIMTAHADVQSAVDSYQTGAFDYLPKPFDLDDVIAVTKKALRQSANPPINSSDQSTELTNPITDSTGTDYLSPNTEGEDSYTRPSGIIGQSAAMQTVFRAIGRLSNTPITVLITGESGTGKELIAHALHEHSPRKNKPFIALNMAAIPHDLIEAELFGHEKGAFTGATTTRQGRFEQAHGGTLFLDEIGDMPLPTQTRLLRVLANGEFFRVGGQKPIKVDVRIIAATHQNLEELVKAGKFREDLFYRLNVIQLVLPALRDRTEDIPLLVNYLLQDIAQKMHLPAKKISPNTMQVLQNFNWRGNVRQLENTCRWLMVMATGQEIQVEDLPPEILQFHLDHAGLTTANSPAIVSQNAQYEKPSIVSPQTFNEGTPNEHLDKNLVSQTLPETVLNHISPAQNPAERSQTPLAHLEATPNHASGTDVALSKAVSAASEDWLTPLRLWAEKALSSGEQQILQTATLDFEKCLLEVALAHTHHHKGQAADLLGWGRNTLTRKYQQFFTGGQ